MMFSKGARNMNVNKVVGGITKQQLYQSWGYRNMPAFLEDFNNSIVKSHMPNLLFNKFINMDKYYGILTPLLIDELKESSVINNISYTRNEKFHILGKMELTNNYIMKIRSEFVFHYLMYHSLLSHITDYQIHHKVIVPSHVSRNIPQLVNLPDIIHYPRKYFLDAWVVLHGGIKIGIEFNEYQSHNSKNHQLHDYIKENEILGCNHIIDEYVTVTDKITHFDIKYARYPDLNQKIDIMDNDVITQTLTSDLSYYM